MQVDATGANGTHSISIPEPNFPNASPVDVTNNYEDNLPATATLRVPSPFHDDGLQIGNFDRADGAVIVPTRPLWLATQPFLQSINACSLPTPNPTDYGLFPVRR